MLRQYGFFFFLAVAILFAGCNHNPKSIEKGKTAHSSSKDSSGPAQSPPPVIKYHAYLPAKKEKATVDSLFAGNLDIILALNRVDVKHLRFLDTIIVPDSFYDDFKAYSPFPWKLDALSNVPKMIFYSYAIQAFAAYENGKLVRWGPVSMGKKATPTPTGLFFTNWRSKETVSTVDDEWIMKWYFNLDNFEGVSMHEYEMPGYPASHACVRLPQKDALFFYDWCEQWILNKDKYHSIAAYGTPVVVFGEYDFAGRRPWRLLAEDKDALTIKASQLEDQLKPFIHTVNERRAARDSLLNVNAPAL